MSGEQQSPSTTFQHEAKALQKADSKQLSKAGSVRKHSLLLPRTTKQGTDWFTSRNLAGGNIETVTSLKRNWGEEPLENTGFTLNSPGKPKIPQVLRTISNQRGQTGPSSPSPPQGMRQDPAQRCWWQWAKAQVPLVYPSRFGPLSLTCTEFVFQSHCQGLLPQPD